MVFDQQQLSILQQAVKTAENMLATAQLPGNDPERAKHWEQQLEKDKKALAEYENKNK